MRNRTFRNIGIRKILKITFIALILKYKEFTLSQYRISLHLRIKINEQSVSFQTINQTRVCPIFNFNFLANKKLYFISFYLFSHVE